MSVLYVGYITNLFTSNLVLKPDTKKELEKTILDIPYDEIIFDFSGVKYMSIEFAKEYTSIKNKTNKVVNEVNIPLAFEPIMDKALESSSGIHSLQFRADMG
ncbi:MAG: hypothetical protein DA329_02265 [Candidatus Nitrosocosmicus sp.]|jgi:hypothetical protein|nr:hypothetical protein [Candidatus Nitrosocosmicus sp.]